MMTAWIVFLRILTRQDFSCPPELVLYHYVIVHIAAEVRKRGMHTQGFSIILRLMDEGMPWWPLAMLAMPLVRTVSIDLALGYSVLSLLVAGGMRCLHS